jgi:hypothetical protein
LLALVAPVDLVVLLVTGVVVAVELVDTQEQVAKVVVIHLVRQL